MDLERILRAVKRRPDLAPDFLRALRALNEGMTDVAASKGAPMGKNAMEELVKHVEGIARKEMGKRGIRRVGDLVATKQDDEGVGLIEGREAVRGVRALAELIADDGFVDLLRRPNVRSMVVGFARDVQLHAMNGPQGLGAKATEVVEVLTELSGLEEAPGSEPTGAAKARGGSALARDYDPAGRRRTQRDDDDGQRATKSGPLRDDYDPAGRRRSTGGRMLR